MSGKRKATTHNLEEMLADIEEDPTKLDDIPLSVLSYLTLNFLDINSILRFCKVSRHFAQICSEGNYPLWNSVLVRSYREYTSLNEYIENAFKNIFEPIVYGPNSEFVFSVYEVWQNAKNHMKKMISNNVKRRYKTWIKAIAAAHTLLISTTKSLLLRKGRQRIIISRKDYDNTGMFYLTFFSSGGYENNMSDIKIRSENRLPFDYQFIDFLTIVLVYYMTELGYDIGTKVVETLKCMICDEVALYKEVTNLENVFCSENCQRVFYSE